MLLRDESQGNDQPPFQVRTRFQYAPRVFLMEDDEHMTAFETVRQRSFRLARAADNTVGQVQEAVTT